MSESMSVWVVIDSACLGVFLYGRVREEMQRCQIAWHEHHLLHIYLFSVRCKIRAQSAERISINDTGES